MSARLRQYLTDAYVGHGEYHTLRNKRDLPIQIDDQDDNDILEDFCNIFITVGKKGGFELEMVGNFPITQDIIDLAEIYDGFVDVKLGRVVMLLSPGQIEVINDLAKHIRETAHLGKKIGNPGWERISARTISSLRRFVRVVKEYQRMRNAGLV
jgi:hypothetical protein